MSEEKNSHSTLKDTRRKCVICGKYHITGEETYLTITGRILVGEKGGLVGHAIDPNWVTYYCRTWECLFHLFKNMAADMTFKEFMQEKERKKNERRALKAILG